MQALDIANLALGHLGQKPISSIEDDPSPAARRVRAVWDGLRDVVLEDADWTFATERMLLDRDPVAPAFEYQSRYELPSYVITVRWANPASTSTAIDAFAASMSPPDTDTVAWVKESGLNSAQERRNYLLVDTLSAQLQVKAIVRVEDALLWSPGFCQALAARIAAEICIPTTQDKVLAAKLFELYGAKLKDASGNDAKQGVPNQILRTNKLAIRRR